MPKVRIYVTLKPALLDSAGRTVTSSLQKLGFSDVEDTRIGKLIEVSMGDPTPERVDAMCRKLLANTVIEDYRYEVIG